MGKKILLAEDSLTIRKVFELAFANTDIVLTTVDNGSDAIRLAEETAHDLVIADVTLPGKDGFRVAEELLASGKTKACPVLVLSGTISPFDEARFRKCGAAAVLFKPFESQEMLEKVQELLREREEAVREEKRETATSAEEPWDFSDVLDEVNRDGRKTTAAAVSTGGEDLLAGASVHPARPEGKLSLGEFDVSLEEIEEAPIRISEAIPEEPAPVVVSHIEGDPFTDAPGAVTDLASGIEAVEEIEEIEDLEEVDILQKEMHETEPGAQAAPPPPAPSAAPHPAASLPADVENALRERFAARADEIFEKVAAETVEKVLWEAMERFSAEFSAKIRESVVAVAWEVIPSTAEALIREEISRIREQTEKKSS